MKEFQCTDVGVNKIILTDKPLIMARPIKMIHKQDGDLNDQPSFCIVMDTMVADFAVMRYIAGEISLAMLNKGLNEIGYQITKI